VYRENFYFNQGCLKKVWTTLEFREGEQIMQMAIDAAGTTMPTLN